MGWKQKKASVKQDKKTHRIEDLDSRIISRMTEFATGLNGDVSEVETDLLLSDLAPPEQKDVEVGNAVCQALTRLVGRVRLRFESVDCAGVADVLDACLP